MLSGGGRRTRAARGPPAGDPPRCPACLRELSLGALRFEELYGRRLDTQYLDEPRRGDHICYISDLRRLRSDYPEWELTVGLDELFAQLAGARDLSPA